MNDDTVPAEPLCASAALEERGRAWVFDVLEHGRAKARRKGADLLVVNAVGGDRGFAVADNDVTIVDGAGEDVAHAAGTKDEVAHAVWDAVVPLLAKRSPQA